MVEAPCLAKSLQSLHALELLELCNPKATHQKPIRIACNWKSCALQHDCNKSKITRSPRNPKKPKHPCQRLPWAAWLSQQWLGPADPCHCRPPRHKELRINGKWRRHAIRILVISLPRLLVVSESSARVLELDLKYAGRSFPRVYIEALRDLALFAVVSRASREMSEFMQLLFVKLRPLEELVRRLLRSLIKRQAW